MIACKGQYTNTCKETDSSRLGQFTRQKKKHLGYQLWKFMNIRCSGYINSAEFLNGCIWQDDNSSTVQIMVIFVS